MSDNFERGGASDHPTIPMKSTVSVIRNVRNKIRLADETLREANLWRSGFGLAKNSVRLILVLFYRLMGKRTLPVTLSPARRTVCDTRG